MISCRGPGATFDGMIRITIAPAAYAAIAGTLPWGTVGVEPQRAENGDYFIWVALGAS